MSLDQKTLRYIAAGFSFILFAWNTYSNFDSITHFDFWAVTNVTGYLLIGIGVLTDKSVISAAGGLLVAVSCLPSWDFFYYLFTGGSYPLIGIIHLIMVFVGRLLLVAVCLWRKNAKVIGIVSSALLGGSLLIGIIQSIAGGYYSFNLMRSVTNLIYVLLPMLVGFAFSDEPINLKIAQTAKTPISTNNAPVRVQPVNRTKGDKITRLQQIKELYDHGLITQEEFTAKKKQILQDTDN